MKVIIKAIACIFAVTACGLAFAEDPGSTPTAAAAAGQRDGFGIEISAEKAARDSFQEYRDPDCGPLMGKTREDFLDVFEREHPGAVVYEMFSKSAAKCSYGVAFDYWKKDEAGAWVFKNKIWVYERAAEQGQRGFVRKENELKKNAPAKVRAQSDDQVRGVTYWDHQDKVSSLEAVKKIGVDEYEEAVVAEPWFERASWPKVGDKVVVFSDSKKQIKTVSGYIASASYGLSDDGYALGVGLAFEDGTRPRGVFVFANEPQADPEPYTRQVSLSCWSGTVSANEDKQAGVLLKKYLATDQAKAEDRDIEQVCWLPEQETVIVQYTGGFPTVFVTSEGYSFQANFRFFQILELEGEIIVHGMTFAESGKADGWQLLSWEEACGETKSFAQ